MKSRQTAALWQPLSIRDVVNEACGQFINAWPLTAQLGRSSCEPQGRLHGPKPSLPPRNRTCIPMHDAAISITLIGSFPTVRHPSSVEYGTSRQGCFLPAILPNGSSRDRPLPQVLEPQQHGQHPFELAVETDLVAAEPFELVRVERLAKGMLTDRRTI
jgi:hypothetical protein